MTGDAEQFSGLHDQIDEAQTAIDKVDSPDAADGIVNGKEEYTQIFLTEVDAVQKFLLENDVEGLNEEAYLGDILGLLQGSLDPKILTNLSDDLHDKLDPIWKETEEYAKLNPDAANEPPAQTTTVEGTTYKPEKPALGGGPFVLNSSDTLTGIVKKYLGIDWEKHPNTAFILVKEINNLRKAEYRDDPDTIHAPETIDLVSFLENTWDSIDWGFDGIGWYKSTSKATEIDTWTSNLRTSSEEKKEVIRPQKTPNEEPKDGEVLKDEAPDEESILNVDNPLYDTIVTAKDTAQHDSEDTQDDYEITDPAWEWANPLDSKDIRIKRQITEGSDNSEAPSEEPVNPYAGAEALPSNALTVEVRGMTFAINPSDFADTPALEAGLETVQSKPVMREYFNGLVSNIIDQALSFEPTSGKEDAPFTNIGGHLHFDSTDPVGGINWKNDTEYKKYADQIGGLVSKDHLPLVFNKIWAEARATRTTVLAARESAGETTTYMSTHLGDGGVELKSSDFDSTNEHIKDVMDMLSTTKLANLNELVSGLFTTLGEKGDVNFSLDSVEPDRQRDPFYYEEGKGSSKQVSFRKKGSMNNPDATIRFQSINIPGFTPKNVIEVMNILWRNKHGL